MVKPPVISEHAPSLPSHQYCFQSNFKQVILSTTAVFSQNIKQTKILQKRSQHLTLKHLEGNNLKFCFKIFTTLFSGDLYLHSQWGKQCPASKWNITVYKLKQQYSRDLEGMNRNDKHPNGNKSFIIFLCCS